MKTEKRIIVRTSFIGLHQWPDAPVLVAFLRHLHRHYFKVAIECEVSHGDRQLEFFTVQQTLNGSIDRLKSLLAEKPSSSCEDMAEFLLYDLRRRYGIKALKVIVSEDGENDGVCVVVAEDVPHVPNDVNFDKVLRQAGR